MPDLDRLFRPRGIAVVGASPDATKIRGRILAALKEGGYPGALVPVNPSHREVQGLRAVARVSDVAGAIDLAILAIPAEHVSSTLIECAVSGVGTAVVLSSGFAEAGPEAAALQKKITAIAAEWDLALLGPNSVGFLNADACIRATFSPGAQSAPVRAVKTPRRAAIVSQSGGIGFAIFNRGVARGVGFNLVATTGNEAGVTTLDVVDYALKLPDTGAILLFVEGLRAGRRLGQIAGDAAEKGVPLIIVKVGRSAAAHRAAISHTASLTGSEALYAAAFGHHGLLRVEEQDELIDLAAAFTACPPAGGKRIGIVTITGGGGAWLADRLEAGGLEVPELDRAMQDEVRRFIPAYGSASNPIDTTAQALETGGRIKSIEALDRAADIDQIAVVASLADVGHLAPEREALMALNQRRTKPLVFASYTLPSADNLAVLDEAGVRCYTSFGGVARGLAALADYPTTRARVLARRARPTPKPVWFELPQGKGVVPEYLAAPALAKAGVPFPPARLARGPHEAAALADTIGYPVALKVQSRGLAHRARIGGVALGLHIRPEVEAAYGRVTEAGQRVTAEPIDGALVQRMAPAGLEMMIGLIGDAELGPFVVAGFGGGRVEVEHDVFTAPAPIDDVEALELLRGLKGASRLFDAPEPLDLVAFARLVAVVSAVGVAHDGRLTEIDLNPVVVYRAGEGVLALDALMVLKED